MAAPSTVRVIAIGERKKKKKEISPCPCLRGSGQKRERRASGRPAPAKERRRGKKKGKKRGIVILYSIENRKKDFTSPVNRFVSKRKKEREKLTLMAARWAGQRRAAPWEEGEKKPAARQPGFIRKPVEALDGRKKDRAVYLRRR